MKKKGLNHVEIVIAFIIFASVILFAYYLILQNKPKDEKDLQQIVYGELKKNLTTLAEKRSVFINSEIIWPSIGINLSRKLNGMGVRTEDLYGGAINSRIDEDSVYVENYPGAIVIIIGEDILRKSNDSVVKREVNESEYKVGSVREFLILSEKRMLEMNKSYYENYEELKKDIGLTNSEDFGLSISFSPEEKLKMERKILKREVYSKTERKEILRADGKIAFADIQIKAW